MSHNPGNNPQSTSTGYKKIVLGKEKYLMPADDIIFNKLTAEVQLIKHKDGIFRIEDDDVTAVYALDDNLFLKKDMDVNNKPCLILIGTDNHYGILCDQIEEVETDNLNLTHTPACMQYYFSPVKKLLFTNNLLHAVIDQKSLFNWLQYQLTGTDMD